MSTNTDQSTDLTFFKLGFIYGWVIQIIDYFKGLPLNDSLKVVVLIITILSGLVLLANHVLTLYMNVLKIKHLKDEQGSDKDKTDSAS